MRVSKMTKDRIEGFNVGWGYVNREGKLFILIKETDVTTATGLNIQKFRWLHVADNIVANNSWSSVKTAIGDCACLTYPETMILRPDQISLNITY